MRTKEDEELLDAFEACVKEQAATQERQHSLWQQRCALIARAHSRRIPWARIAHRHCRASDTMSLSCQRKATGALKKEFSVRQRRGIDCVQPVARVRGFR